MGKTEAVFGAQATHKVRDKTASAGNIWLRPDQKQTSSVALLPQLRGRVTTATARDTARTGRNSPEFQFHPIRCHLADCEHRCRARHRATWRRQRCWGGTGGGPPPRELQPSLARRVAGLHPHSCGSPTCKDPALQVQLVGHADLGAELQHQQHGQDHDNALPEQRRLEAPPEPAGEGPRRQGAQAGPPTPRHGGTEPASRTCGGRGRGVRGRWPGLQTPRWHGAGMRRGQAPPRRPDRASTAPQSRVKLQAAPRAAGPPGSRCDPPRAEGRWEWVSCPRPPPPVRPADRRPPAEAQPPPGEKPRCWNTCLPRARSSVWRPTAALAPGRGEWGLQASTAPSVSREVGGRATQPSLEKRRRQAGHGPHCQPQALMPDQDWLAHTDASTSTLFSEPQPAQPSQPQAPRPSC